jgi:hypothetical protein
MGHLSVAENLPTEGIVVKKAASAPATAATSAAASVAAVSAAAAAEAAIASLVAAPFVNTCSAAVSCAA